MKLIILSILVLVGSSIKDDPKHWPNPQPSVESPTDSFSWFDQILDHYNYQSTQLWKQRYWVVDKYFNPNVGPIFLYICGEYVCPGVPASRQWVVTLAQRLQGLIFVVQHRYYGQSLPFGNDSLKLQNMVYLSSEQALADLAYFISKMGNTAQYRTSEKNKWITVGGSYPGALSAWFRYKYPHLTIGSLASSAVVQAIEDYKDFDEQIYLSTALSGDQCVQAVNASNQRVEGILNSSSKEEFKANFTGGEKLTDDQFLFYWIDSIVGVIQYGQRTNLCNGLKNKSSDDQFSFLVKNAQDTNDVYEYGSYYLKNLTFQMEEGSGSRSWLYQCCTEYGFWQTPSQKHPMRSFRLTLDFYRKVCGDVFGEGSWPKVERNNIEFGGFNQQSTNLYMYNGIEDPWRWASIQKSQGKIISRVGNCTNCAHCGDLYTPSSSDPPELKKVRDEEYLNILDWINAASVQAEINLRTE